MIRVDALWLSTLPQDMRAEMKAFWPRSYGSLVRPGRIMPISNKPDEIRDAFCRNAER